MWCHKRYCHACVHVRATCLVIIPSPPHLVGVSNSITLNLNGYMHASTRQFTGTLVFGGTGDPGRVGMPAEETLVMTGWSADHDVSSILAPQVSRVNNG